METCNMTALLHFTNRFKIQRPTLNSTGYRKMHTKFYSDRSQRCVSVNTVANVLTRLEIIKAENTKIIVFWNVNLSLRWRHKFLLNISTYLLDFTATHPHLKEFLDQLTSYLAASPWLHHHTSYETFAGVGIAQWV
jgi:hypothetical protein